MNIRTFETELTITKYKEIQSQFEKSIWNPYMGKRWFDIKGDPELDPNSCEENKIRWSKYYDCCRYRCFYTYLQYTGASLTNLNYDLASSFCQKNIFKSKPRECLWMNLRAKEDVNISGEYDILSHDTGVTLLSKYPSSLLLNGIPVKFLDCRLKNDKCTIKRWCYLIYIEIYLKN